MPELLIPGDDCGSCCDSRTPPVFETYASTLSGADRSNSSDSCDEEEVDNCCSGGNKRQVHQVRLAVAFISVVDNDPTRQILWTIARPSLVFQLAIYCF